MKKSPFIFTLIAMAISINTNAGNMHKVFGPHERVIKNSSKISIMLLDPTPILSLDQQPGENYVYDYPIIRTSVIAKKIGAALTATILDTNQYLYGINKKCPFMGKFAVQYRQGKTTITMLFSEPCAKAIIFCPGSIIDKKHIDLIDGSAILNALKSFIEKESIPEKSKSLPQN